MTLEHPNQQRYPGQKISVVLIEGYAYLVPFVESVRTLQDLEQGRRAPSGAARTLLMVADRNPDALLEVA